MIEESDDELFEQVDEERDSNCELLDVEMESSGEEMMDCSSSAGKTIATTSATATPNSGPAVPSASTATADLAADSWPAYNDSYINT